MAAIPRKTALLLGGAINNPSGLVEGPAGSYAAGSVQYNLDPAVIQNIAGGTGSAWWQGFYQMLVQTGGGVNSPAYQTLQAIFLVLSQQIAYTLEHGMAEWDSTGKTTYYQFDTCSVAGVWYQCTSTSGVTSNPTTDTNNWILFSSTLSGPNFVQAKVCFNGTTGTITGTAFNVSSITKNGVGNYTINFTNQLTDANYAWCGSCGAANGTSGGQGNVVCGGALGVAGVKTRTQLGILCVEIAPNQLVDSNSICVIVV